MPWYRHPVFTATHLDRMQEIICDVCADFGARLAEFNGEPEHAHLPVNLPPTAAISRLVNSLKGVSTRRLWQAFPDLRRHYCRANRLWSGSYFAGSVGGAPISVLRQYIKQQNRPGRRRLGPPAFTAGLKAGAPADIVVGSRRPLSPCSDRFRAMTRQPFASSGSMWFH